MKKCLLILLMALHGITLAQEETDKRFVSFETNMGNIVLELYPDKAPKTVNNFVRYVVEGFYDGTVFHRVIANFMIQGGGYGPELLRKPTHEPIENEADNMLPNARGTLAMARTMNPHSATAQFFINVVDNVALNHTGKTHSNAWGYAVFGQVIQGMEVVDAIRMVETGPSGPFRSDVPREPVIIVKASLLDAPPVPPTEPSESGDTGDTGEASPEAEQEAVDG